MSRPLQSAYMQWAKLRSKARYNLASSGVLGVLREEFTMPIEDLEINGPDGYGYGLLLQQIAQHTGAPENCIATAAGTSMANHLAMAAVLQPGDEVLIEQPGYGLLVEVAEYLGARVKRFSRRFENGFNIDLDELATQVSNSTRLIVLSNLHNPSGAITTAEALRKTGEIARRTGALVLVDEVYLGMLFEAEPLSAFTLDRDFEHSAFIVTNSLTKTYGLSGLRCGWILARPEITRRIWLLNDFFGVNAPHLAECASVVAFNELARFRERAKRLLAANRALLDSFLDSRSDLETFRPPAGTIVFPRLKRGDTQQFIQLLRDKYETSVVPGEFFEMPDHFRIGVGGPTDEVRKGLDRIGAALEELKS
ncbi:MAG: pyridoxal phosphate-dependent aminotransferase [Chthoniobacterales bacterium]